VGKAFQSKQTIFTEDISKENEGIFMRKSQAMDEGLVSMAFVPTQESVIELGFFKRLESPPQTAPLEEGGYVLEDHSKIQASIPGIGKVKEDIKTLTDLLRYIPNEAREPDIRDKDNTDKWVPRDPRLNRLTGIHPFNC